MKRFRNILCVLPAEDPCSRTLERAVSLAENNQALLTVATVMPPLVPPTGIQIEGRSITDLQLALVGEREQALAVLTEPYRQRIPITHQVLTGTGFLEVIRAVLSVGHDLVIKPAEGRALVRRLFGSDDMHLLRKCPCPVWLTKPGETTNYSSILAAVDFDPDAPGSVGAGLNNEILDLASSLALSDFAALNVVHVWDAPGELTIRLWSDSADAGTRYVEAERSRHQWGMDRLAAQLREQLGPEAYDHLAPTFRLQRGKPASVIPQLATQLPADLVVMGTVARTGVPGLIIGNTAESVLEQLDCSVLAIKPPGFVTPVKVLE